MATLVFYRESVGSRPFTLTRRRWTPVYGGRGQPNKTHLFTRHCSALHTVLQHIKDGAEGIRRQMLLAWRHQADHIPVHLLHSGGSRHRNERTPTGKEQKRQTPHVWKLEGWEVNRVEGRAESLSGFFYRSMKLQGSAHSLNHSQYTWAVLWLAERWIMMSYTCLSTMCLQQLSSTAH